jgi:hypothetical protein
MDIILVSGLFYVAYFVRLLLIIANNAYDVLSIC